LRKLLVVGAHAVLFHRKPCTDRPRMWAKKLIEKKPFKLVPVALANKDGEHRFRDPRPAQRRKITLDRRAFVQT
jgi:transposase